MITPRRSNGATIAGGLSQEERQRRFVRVASPCIGGIMSDLDTFESPGDHIANFETDELTARCPFEFGGPDHYDLLIRYRPDELAVESKSLKLWLESYRDKEITAEALGRELYETITDAIEPQECYIRLEQARRGGIEETVEVGDYELKS